MNIFWNRLRYVLSPQFDIYEQVAKHVYGRVADVGCGTGFGTHLLAVRADEVFGYDSDTSAIEFAKRAFPMIKFGYGDIVKGIQMDKCNFVVMIDAIEHIEKDLKAVKQVRKMLTENGIFICSTPNRLSRYRKSEAHVREYSPNTLRELLGHVFTQVIIADYKLDESKSSHDNPIVAICSNGSELLK